MAEYKCELNLFSGTVHSLFSCGYTDHSGLPTANRATVFEINWYIGITLTSLLVKSLITLLRFGIHALLIKTYKTAYKTVSMSRDSLFWGNLVLFRIYIKR